MHIRCCVFVDGENLRHAIVDLFTGAFAPKDYLPKRADWAGFFDWLVTKAVQELTTASSERVRTYWYAVGSLDISPYLPFPKEPVAQGKLLSRHKPFEVELKQLKGKALEERVQALIAELESEARRMHRRFDGWLNIQNGISLKHTAVEFRRAGAIRYNLFDHQLGREKAVDVKLATDLIMLRDVYDLAIIVSGDQDYVPAVEVVKDSGKRVVNVSFETRSGRLLPGGARRLNQVTDWNIRLSHADFATHMNIESGRRQR